MDGVSVTVGVRVGVFVRVGVLVGVCPKAYPDNNISAISNRFISHLKNKCLPFQAAK